MQEFIVLGHIPGTNIYLDFEALLVITMLVLLLVLAFMHRKQVYQQWHAHIAGLRARKVLQLLTHYHLL